MVGPDLGLISVLPFSYRINFSSSNRRRRRITITSRRSVPPLPAHHSPRQTERMAPEDGAHRRGVVFAGDKCADGIQGSVLPRSGGRAILEINTFRIGWNCPSPDIPPRQRWSITIIDTFVPYFHVIYTGMSEMKR